jgi:hypothetical protein
MTSKWDSDVASSLIQKITSINASSPSILHDESSRVQALNLARKLVNVLEKPDDAALQTALSVWTLSIGPEDLSLMDIHSRAKVRCHGLLST